MTVPLEPLRIERRTTSSRVAEALRDELLNGAWPPGSQVRDAALAERTGVSRPTAREAIAQLVHDGLLVHTLHRGVEVVRLTAADVRDAYRARWVLEGAGLAALLADPERRAPQVESALTDLAAAVAGGAALRDAVAADMRLHLAVVALAGSDRLIRAARGVAFELRLVLAFTDRRPGRPEHALAEHERLVDQLRTAAPRRARAALRQHLDAAEALVCASLE